MWEGPFRHERHCGLGQCGWLRGDVPLKSVERNKVPGTTTLDSQTELLDIKYILIPQENKHFFSKKLKYYG